LDLAFAIFVVALVVLGGVAMYFVHETFSDGVPPEEND
jgi:hypothetical protein